MVQPGAHGRWQSLFGLTFVIAVFAMNVYRATHQSITIDEAFTYDLYEPTRRLGLHVIYRDPVSGQELAVPGVRPALASQVRF